jgi:hypothetical protein
VSAGQVLIVGGAVLLLLRVTTAAGDHRSET